MSTASKPVEDATTLPKPVETQGVSRKRAGLPRSRNPWDKLGFIPWAQRQFPYLKNELQHIADSIFNFAEDELYAGSYKPTTNVVENADAIVITMDLPGFEPDAIEIKVTDDTLTVSGERETTCCEAEESDVVLHRNERCCGMFTRTFALPGNVSEDISAKCGNGVLTITLAKSEPENVRKIKVTS